MRSFLCTASLALIACGPPGGSAVSVFTLKQGGDGPDLVKHINRSPSARWLYQVTVSGFSSASENYFEGTVQIPDGPVVDRLVTETQVVYQEQSDSGQYYWGSSDGDLLQHPLVTLSYPLKVNRAWSTGTAAFPEWYQYSVEAVEKVETPAGTFDAARVVQFNSRANSTVTRWYVDDLGLVQRSAETGNGVSTTLLLSYQLEAK